MGKQDDTPLTPAQAQRLAAIRAYLEQQRAIYHRDALHAKLLEDGHDPQLIARAVADIFPPTDHIVDVRNTTTAYLVFWIGFLLFLVLNLLAVLPLGRGIRIRPIPEPTLAECQPGVATPYREWCPSVLYRHRQQAMFFGLVTGEVVAALVLTFGLRGRWRLIGRGLAAGMMIPVAIALLFFGVCAPPVH